MSRKTCRICLRALPDIRRTKAGRPSNAHPKCRAVVAEHILAKKFTREAQLPGNARHKFEKGEEFAEDVNAHSRPGNRGGSWEDFDV